MFCAPGAHEANVVLVDYDYESLALEIKQEGLPQELTDTIRHRWWTAFLEIVPAEARKKGSFPWRPPKWIPSAP